MSNEADFVSVLRQADGPLCDDCMATAAGWNQRQQANQVGRRLAARGTIARASGACSACNKTKTVSELRDGPPPRGRVRDQPERPRAFVSHAAVLQDDAVARNLEVALRTVGFDVHASGHAAGVTMSADRVTLPEIFGAHVLIPIISRAYLTDPGCLQELSSCRTRVLKTDALLVPLHIEQVDAARLDAYGQWALDGLDAHDGPSGRQVPADAELRELAESLPRLVAARGLWKPPDIATAAHPPVGDVRRPASKQVFISHAQHDSEKADLVCTALESAGIGCWIAPRDILPGRYYSGAVMEGLAACRILLLLYSAHSNASRHVVKELDGASNRDMVLIRLRLENVPLSPDLEYYLSATQWLDALTPPLDGHLPHLVEVISEQLRLLSQAAGEDP